MYYFESFGDYSLELEGTLEEILKILSNKSSKKDDKLQESTLKPANKCVNDDPLPSIEDEGIKFQLNPDVCSNIRNKYFENVAPSSKQFPRYTVKNEEEIGDFTIENKIKVHDVTKSIINAVGKTMMDYK